MLRFVLAFLLSTTALAAEPLNVLFIATDDLRNDLACYGNSLVKAPNIDRLAKSGLVFNGAYCQQALCNPSRASLMTGRRVDTLRIWELATHFRTAFPELVTLPQHFRNAGYFTRNIGKIYHNWRQDIEGDPESWSIPAELHFNTHYADEAKVEGSLPPNLVQAPKCECRDVPDEAYFDGRVASKAIEALEEFAEKRRTFFLAVGFWKPHAPFNAPKKYWDLYDRANVPMPINPTWPKDSPEIARHNGKELQDQGKDAVALEGEVLREVRHGYLANISYLDAQVGKVLDALDRLKLTDKTVVVFWSDHGYHLGEHALFAKTSNFDLDARVPLIFRVPQLPSAVGNTDSLAELLDIYPTLSELCELPNPVGLEGKSLVPILKDPKASVREVAMTQHPRPAYYNSRNGEGPTHMGYSLRTATHRYTEWRDWKSGATIASELYDHVLDPNETMNVVESTTNQVLVEELKQLLSKQNPLVRPGWNGSSVP
jgi:iduronate 2-sulfatase